MRPTAVLAAIVAFALCVGIPSTDPRAATESVASVEAAIEVERTLIAEDLAKYEALVARRAQANTRLQELHAEVDALLRAGPGIEVGEVDRRLVAIDAAEAERDAILAGQRAVLAAVVERARRARALEDRLGPLKERGSSTRGPLDGRWNVVVMPLGQRGTFELAQSGTIVNGTYQLDGGWTGSLQGTLVNRKVFLVRIDSRLGRSMEFEGTLSSDGDVIRGSWRSYDLGAEGGHEGQWSASRPE